MKINFLPAKLLILCPGGGIGRRKGLKSFFSNQEIK